MNGVLFTPLKRIQTVRGDVLHAIKASDQGFESFGEAYFSIVANGAVKGWKRHRRMVMNLIVPVGEVKFVLHDARDAIWQPGVFESFVMSPKSRETYGRLTVPPGVWMAFTSLAEGLNMVLNVASIEHDPEEADNVPLDAIPYDWPANGSC